MDGTFHASRPREQSYPLVAGRQTDASKPVLPSGAGDRMACHFSRSLSLTLRVFGYRSPAAPWGHRELLLYVEVTEEVALLVTKVPA